MQRLFFILLVLTLASCSREIPQEIRQRHKEFVQRDHDPDVILSPIEQVPVYPSVRSLTGGNYAYDLCQVPNVQPIIEEKAKRKVEVFVFDTGGDYDHPALSEATRNGKTYTGENPIDKNGHSTHVAGIIAGKHNGAKKVGIAYSLVEKGLLHIRPYKVLSNGGSGSYYNIERAIEDANDAAKNLISQGYFVIYNFSLGGTGKPSGIEDALQEAKKLGVLISMASNGNGRSTSIKYPGSSVYTQGIAAIDRNKRHAFFSDRGSETSFAFPGVGIYATHLNGRYRELSGTSMAAPVGAGVAAIVASIYEDANAAEIVAHMAKYAEDLGSTGKDDKYGYGFPQLVDLLKDAPEDQPDDDPDDDPDQPTDPEPDPDPAPEPDYPKRSHTFTLPDQYIMYWRTRKITSMQSLPIKIVVKYKHQKALADAADEIRSTADGYFGNRGLILRDGSDEADVAYWTKRFFDMMEGDKKDRDIEVVKIMYQVEGTWLCLDDFSAVPSTNRRQRKHHGNLVFSW